MRTTKKTRGALYTKGNTWLDVRPRETKKYQGKKKAIKRDNNTWIQKKKVVLT